MYTKEALVILASPDKVEEIASLIAQDYITVLPYGRRERRMFALVGSAHSQTVIDRMLQIKQRSTSQALAISGIPEVAPIVAELDQTQALVSAARRIHQDPQMVVNRCFKLGAVGLVLAAQDWLPKEATRIRDGRKTVLIAGEVTDEEFDIFPNVYRTLIKDYGKVMVGTSANITGEDTYHIFQQDEALGKLGKCVDLFVCDNISRYGRFPLFRHLTSTTMIDLTGDRPKVTRWGNVYPGHFKEIFPDLVFQPGKLNKYKGRESALQFQLERLIPIPGLLKT